MDDWLSKWLTDSLYNLIASVSRLLYEIYSFLLWPLEQKVMTIILLNCLFSLFSSDFSVGVGDFDVELSGSFNDRLSIFHWNIVRNLSGVLSILKNQQFQFFNVVNSKLVKSWWKHVLGLLVGTITNSRRKLSALVAASNFRVNT